MSINEEKLQYLKAKARDIRKSALETMHGFGSGHVGASLSMADILAVLYFDKMTVDPKNPKWEDRDQLVVSKGHGGPGVYAALYHKGFFDHDFLMSLNKKFTNLPSHCDMIRTPGIDQTAGSLGQGVSCALGKAIGCQMLGKTNHVYCIMGDGEIEEGQAWEAFMMASAKRQSNLTIIIDRNHLQNSYNTEDASRLEDLSGKFKAFNFNTIEINGHDISEISDAIDAALAYKEGPTCIIANTIKGRGFKAREGKINVHFTTISDAEYLEACQYIDETM